MKRILVLIPNNKGTIAIRAYDLIHELEKRGCIVQVASYNKKAPDGLDFKNIIYYNQKNNIILKNILRIFWLIRIKRIFQPDISISTLNGCSRLSILTFGKDYKIGIFRAPVEQDKGLFNNLMDRLSFYLFYNKLNRLFCVSKEVENSIKRNFPHINSCKIETVYNTFDRDRIFNLANAVVGDIDFYNKSIFTFINIGRVELIKGQERIIRAISLIPKEIRTKIRLLIIGETNITYNKNNYYSKILDLTSQLNLTNQVIFIGHQSNPYKYLYQSDCLIISSYEEGLPGALIESLILNKKAISTNCSLGVWEIMDVEKFYNPELTGNFNTKNGIITSNLSKISNNFIDEEKDIHNLRNAMISILESKDNTGTLDLRKFSIDFVIEKYIGN